jgi:hypothetical protein
MSMAYSVEAFWPCGLALKPIQDFINKTPVNRGFGVALPFDSAEFPCGDRKDAFATARRLKAERTRFRLLKVIIWHAAKGKPAKITRILDAPEGFGL